MTSRSTNRFGQLGKGALSAVLATGLILGLAPDATALSSSSGVLPVTPGPSITKPAPKGEAVSLYELRDSGTAAKDPVTIGGTQYPSPWSFNTSPDLKVQLNGDYTTLSGTFGIEDDSDTVESVKL